MKNKDNWRGLRVEYFVTYKFGKESEVLISILASSERMALERSYEMLKESEQERRPTPFVSLIRPKNTLKERHSFKDKIPELGEYISIYWVDGSDCECVYSGLDEEIKPLPDGWYYVN